MTLTFTTTDLPPAADALPADTGTGRPDDADSLRRSLSWARNAVWPGVDVPPWSVAAVVAQSWPACDGIFLSAQVSPWLEARSWEYHDAVARKILHSLASAAVVVHVTGDDIPPGEHEHRAYVWDLTPPLYRDGYQVQLQSWAYLQPTVRNRWGEAQDGGIDTAALWRWSAADRAAPDGRRTAKERDQSLTDLLPAALATAQAMHDALQLLLPQAIPQTTPAPTHRRNSWR